MNIEIGSFIFQDWKIVRKIGAGASGTVYEIRKESQGATLTAAVKVLRVPEDPGIISALKYDGMSEQSATNYLQNVVDELVREIRIMISLKEFPYVVHCEDFFVEKDRYAPQWTVAIRMEMLDSLSGYQEAHDLTEADVHRLGRQLLMTLEQLERHDVIHRDIKPENIFVTKYGDFKLGDFGIARVYDQTTAYLSQKGTQSYMAPEVFHGQEYDHSVDIYSLGLVLYRYLNKNRLPFLPVEGDFTPIERQSALAMRLSGRKELPAPVCASPEFSRIVRKMCACRPEDRYSNARQALRELESFQPSEEVILSARSSGSAAQDADATMGGYAASGAGWASKGQGAGNSGSEDATMGGYAGSDAGWASQGRSASNPGSGRSANGSYSSSGAGWQPQGQGAGSVGREYGASGSSASSAPPSGGGWQASSAEAPERKPREGRGYKPSAEAQSQKSAPKSRKLAWILAATAVVVLLAAALPVISELLSRDNPASTRTDAPAAGSASAPVAGTVEAPASQGATMRKDFEGDYYGRAAFATIQFADSLAGAPSDAWDVSEKGDSSVLAWATRNGDLYDLTIAGEGGVRAPADSSKLFANCGKVREIRFDNCFDTSGVRDMSSMFIFCYALNEVNLSSLDTANVTDMSDMFANCNALSTLDVSSLNTANVTNMEAMFFGCSSLNTIDLSSFNTANVTNMLNMFQQCSSLSALDLSSFNTSRVTDMGAMFNHCESLGTLDLSSFDTSKVTNMGGMFFHCSTLSELNLSSFDTSKVTNMAYMFSECGSLRNIQTGEGFVIASKTNVEDMFKDCPIDHI